MLGNLDNPYPVIKHAMLMILSSDYEGLPTVLVESFVLSTPVVSVDCKYGPAEILGEKYQNYLAKQGDIGDLAEKIKSAVSDIQKNILKVNPGHVEKFNIEGLAEKYVDLVSCNERVESGVC
jgi:glycosyltransferase involved in cell wall biosynthesis